MTVQQHPLPLYAASLGWAVGCSKRGAAHKRTAAPCQDAYALWQGSVSGLPCLALAVADGHGDERHDLSQFGAALAVKAALDEMVSLFSHFGMTGNPSSLKSTFKSDVPRRVVRRWRGLVMEDAVERLGGTSASTSGESSQADHQKVWTRYGTTLLAALVTSNSILTAQIGDGQLLLVRSDGHIDRPMKTAALLGTNTHSLCSTDAHLLWQTHFIDKEGGGLLLMTTDGLPDSLDDKAKDESEFHAFARSLMDRIRDFGIEKVAGSLPAWLEHFSDQGSGDDMTIALALIQGDAPTAAERSSTETPGDNSSMKENGDATHDRRPDQV